VGRSEVGFFETGYRLVFWRDESSRHEGWPVAVGEREHSRLTGWGKSSFGLHLLIAINRMVK